MDRIKELRQKKGWTQAQLGKRIGVAKTTICGYEAGERQPDIEKICAICDQFNCTADYLIGRSETRLPAVTDEQARLLEAYQAASLRDRALVDQILAAYMPAAKGKTGS